MSIPIVPIDPKLVKGGQANLWTEHMRDEELEGTHLVPNAVNRGEYERHIQGLQRGNTTGLEPSTRPADITPLPDPADPGRGSRRPQSGADRPPTDPPESPTRP